MRFRLNEFAYDRHKIEDMLVNKSPEIVEHLIKIYLYPDDVNTNHWKDEIYSFINRVPKIKFNNKFPSSKFIYEKTYGVWWDTIPNMIKKVVSEYGDYHINYNIGDILDFCSRYFNWLSRELSSNGLILKKNVYSTIDELLVDYEN